MKISRRTVAKTSLSLPALYFQMRTDILGAADQWEGDVGVASGTPRPDSVIIWTRVPGEFRTDLTNAGTVSVRYEMSKTEQFQASDIVARGQLSTSSLSDFTVKSKITGLQPFTTYYYRFTTASGYASVIGRTKTAPAPGSDPHTLKIGVVACQRYSGGFFPAYTHLATEDLDYCIHLGDHIYEIESGHARPDTAMNGAVAKTLGDFRLKYRFYLSDPAWREARRLFPWIDLWDDHEVVDNYSGPQLGQTDPARLTGGYQAFCEYMPNMPQIVPQTGAPAEVRIYDQLKFGDLIDMYLLDQRQYRTPGACPSDFMTPGCPALEGPANTMLGPDQKAWFKDRLSHSSAKWQFVLSELVFSKFLVPGRGPNTDIRSFTEDFDTYKSQSNVYLNLDAWDGYPAERQELLRFVSDNHITNVVFLSGDVHSAYNSKLFVNDGDTIPVALEVVTSPISSAPLQRGLTRFFGADATPVIMTANPWTVWADINHNGYTVITADQDKLTVEHKIVASTAAAQSDLSIERTIRILDGQPDFTS